MTGEGLNTKLAASKAVLTVIGERVATLADISSPVPTKPSLDENKMRVDEDEQLFLAQMRKEDQQRSYPPDLDGDKDWFMSAEWGFGGDGPKPVV